MQAIPGLSDHEAVVCDCIYAPCCTKTPPRIVHIFSNANWESLSTEVHIFSEKYDQLYYASSVAEKWTAFKNKLTGLLDKYFPYKCTSTRYNAPRITSNLKRQEEKVSSGKLRRALGNPGTPNGRDTNHIKRVSTRL